VRRTGRLLLGSALAAGLIGGCRGAAAPDDAGVDTASDGGSDGPVPLRLEMAVNGCAHYDLDSGVCSGPAPMTVAFAPVGSPELTRFKWTFGDGTPAVDERAPVHRYTLPGSYDVRVVGQVGEPDLGTIECDRKRKIRVDPVAIGGLCDLDAQCGTGPTCTCSPGSGCAAAFLRGLCTIPCPEGLCLGATCVTLAVAGSAGDTARRPYCLAGCARDADCATGLVCTTLPSGASDGPRWRRACLPRGAVIAPGGSCRDANELLDDARCATGMCADMGTLGLCSAECVTTGDCPDDTACGYLTDGRSLCLPTCDAANACTTDPLLLCQTPGPVVEPRPDTDYCAPRACTRDDECSPGGRCGADAVCVRR
jgi:hypothetical protein